MSSPTSTAVRRVCAVIVLPLVLALGACGVQYNYEITDKDTVNVSMLIWGDQVSESDCTNQNNSKSGTSGITDTNIPLIYTYTQYNGDPACEAHAADVPVSQFDSDNNITITHSGNRYVVDINIGDTETDSTYSDLDASISVTFPGKVTDATGNSVEKDGNTVTWTDITQEKGTVHAEGKDSAGLPWLWIVLGLVVVAIIAAVVLFLLMQKKKSAGAPMVGAPGQPYPQQPGGYPQPVQPGQPYQQQPGGYAQPGQPVQPGQQYPQQAQPGQQYPQQPGGYNPGKQSGPATGQY